MAVWLGPVVLLIWAVISLWSGKFYIRGRTEPFTRQEQPRRYWMAVSATLISALLIAVAAASL
jgi:hypothetical protein